MNTTTIHRRLPVSAENTEYPKVRISKQAHAHLIKLVPAVREDRGLNVSMTDLASEAILSIPIPQPQPKPVEKKRQIRKSAKRVSTRSAAAEMAL
jgi:hypothetical protein